MVNSHYVPQFILRNFYGENNRITYCDLLQEKVELRNTRSVFSEIGYYPDELEKDLCKNAEYLFANLYHNKLENAGNSITLTAEELFLIKKYLIISTIRYHFEDTESDAALRKQLGKAFQEDFFGNINKILKCQSTEDLMDIIDTNIFDTLAGETDTNIPLFTEVKDVVHSYLVFVKTRGNEQFLIPDIGRGIYEGPMSRRKMYGSLAIAMQQLNPVLLKITPMLTPHDYTVFPLSKNMAVLSMSVFFKLFTDSEMKSNVILPADCPTVSSILGFGDKNTVKPPKVRRNMGKKEYHYDVQYVTAADVAHLNSLMIAEARRYVVCANLDNIKRSVETARDYTERPLNFMMKTASPTEMSFPI